MLMQLEYPQRNDGMYILKRTDFDNIATSILKEYMPHVLESPQKTPINYLAEEELFLSFQKRHITPNGSVLGLIAFGDTEITIYDENLRAIRIEIEEATVLIDQTLFGTDQQRRLNFTLAHEVSHWLLHRSYHHPDNKQFKFRINNDANAFIACRSDNIERSNKKQLITPQDWEEWQADSLSASLLMPLRPFEWAIIDAIRSVNIKERDLKASSSNIYNNKNQVFLAKKYLSNIFNVSITAVEIRLLQLGYL
jgi:Zn-dependent peptidase ImmA (M78 family)